MIVITSLAITWAIRLPLSCCVAGLCSRECKTHLTQQDNGNLIAQVIASEVITIMANDPFLSIDHCTTECDAVFDLVASDDEQTTDQLCEESCKCEINKHYNAPECKNRPTSAPATTKHHHG